MTQASAYAHAFLPVLRWDTLLPVDKMFLDGLYEFSRVKRFSEILCGTSKPTAHLVKQTIFPTEHNNRNLSKLQVFPYYLANIVPIHARQLNVEQDHSRYFISYRG